MSKESRASKQQRAAEELLGMTPEQKAEKFPNIIDKYMLDNPIIVRGLVRKKPVTNIIIHSPGVAQSDPYHIYKRWNRASAKAAVHFILNDEAIYRLLPESSVCWGTGRGKRGSVNNQTIQIECCEPNGHKYNDNHEIIDYDVKANADYFTKMWTNLVKLCYAECYLHGLGAASIKSHREVALLGYASNHKDPEHWFTLHGKTMEDLRCDVRKMLSSK